MIAFFRARAGFLQYRDGPRRDCLGHRSISDVLADITVEQTATAVVNRVQFKPGALHR